MRLEDLPPDVAANAEAAIAAGRFGSVDEVVRAAFDLFEDEARFANPEWIAYARREWNKGVADSDAGRAEIIRSASEFMGEICQSVGLPRG